MVDHDLQPLCKAREMASSWMRSLFNTRMEYTQPQEVSNWYWIINPLWVQLAKQINKLDDILRHVQQRDYVFIPTLHSTRWVRWMKMRNSQTSLDE